MSRTALRKFFIFSILLGFWARPSFGQHGHDTPAHVPAAAAGEAEKFNPGQTILHHVADAHEWHLATVNGEHYSIPLPVILYSPTQGLKVYNSSHFYHSPTGEHDGFRLEHEHFTAADGSKVYDFCLLYTSPSPRD